MRKNYNINYTSNYLEHQFCFKSNNLQQYGHFYLLKLDRATII